MNATVDIKALEPDTVRVFALSLSDADAKPYVQDNARATELLGVDQIDPQYVEIFPVSDLEGLGLIGYLTEGQGIPDTLLAPDRSRLAALDGHVMVVMSRAFADRAVQLELDPRVTLIGSYAEDKPPVTFEPLPAEMAKGALTGTADVPPVNHGRGYKILLLIIAIVVLIALALGALT
ncbi:MAG: hypothetical protein VX974_00405 [Pseudomonadota bacterium]|nr:hypothetical protein [Pseudomonadota bacterium]